MNPRITRIVFPNVEEFASALEGATGQFIPTARSTQAWWLQSIFTDRLLMQTFQVGGPATFAGDGKQDQIALLIPLTNPSNIRVDGRSLARDSLLLIREHHPFVLSTVETTRWAGIVVPSIYDMLAADLIKALKSHLSLKVDRLATSHPHANAEALDGILSIAHMLDASRRARRTPVGRPGVARGRVIAKVIETVESSVGMGLTTEQLCHLTGVAERTLRNIFREYFGIGPIRFLKVRQLQAIREALLTADSKCDSVTRIAEHFGIWDVSLFARNYKALFGETPSETLRAPPTPALQATNGCGTWLHYASHAFSRENSHVVQRMIATQAAP